MAPRVSESFIALLEQHVRKAKFKRKNVNAGIVKNTYSLRGSLRGAVHLGKRHVTQTMEVSARVPTSPWSVGPRVGKAADRQFSA